MQNRGRRLRVALVAGTLGQGGAEKQLVYMARELQNADAEVRVYCLTRGEFYESALQKIGLPPVWIGRPRSRVRRLWTQIQALKQFRPDVIQSAHTFANSYVSLAGRRLKTLNIGALRSSVSYCRSRNGLWTDWLIRSNTGLIVNAITTADEILDQRIIPREQMFVVPNVIDVDEDTAPPSRNGHGPTDVYFIGRLVRAKRLDRFIEAVALAGEANPSLRAVVVGDGPERASMERLAEERFPHRISFLGNRRDIPDLLRHAAMLVVTSDDEGSPNVVLEAMAAGVPVVSTPVGDVSSLLKNGDTGFLVAFDDLERLAQRINLLSHSQLLQRQVGETARVWVHRNRNPAALSKQLFTIYHTLARRHGRTALEGVLTQSGDRPRRQAQVAVTVRDSEL